MKIHTLFLLAILLIMTSACSDKDGDMNPLEKEVEKDLTIRSGQRMYLDDLGNKFHAMEFNKDRYKQVFKMNLIEGKRYHILVYGEYYSSIRFCLQKENSEIVYKDPATISQRCKHEFFWTAETGGTYYLSAELMKDSEFQSASNKLMFEEMNPYELTVGNLQLLCSGDWFINEDGFLTLIRYGTLKHSWAKILNTSDNSYDFSYSVYERADQFNKYVGIMFAASDDIIEETNLPKFGNFFETDFPYWWRIGTNYFESGEFNQTIPAGTGYWLNIGLKVTEDSIVLSADDVILPRYTHVGYLNTGLYITAWSGMPDTTYFKNIKVNE